MGNPSPTILSIGHSTHELDRLMGLLAAHRIDVVADVRSNPQSRHASQFNAPTLRDALIARGMRYLPMGDELGGRPRNPEYYDADGHVRYERVAASEAFLRGIDRLVEGTRTYRIAVMCSEEDPVNCHRWRLIGRVLSGRGIEMGHIRGDGTLQTNESIAASDVQQHRDLYQTRLFDGTADRWRSTKPIAAFGRDDRGA